MRLVALGIGSNISPAANLRRAARALDGMLGPLRRSSVYESEAQGFDGGNFLNAAVAGRTAMDPPALRDALKELERRLGRDHGQPRFSSRTIDIDILVIGELAGGERGLELPHPDILRCAFVLRPLSEVLPEDVHGPSGRSYRELWERFDGGSGPLRRLDFDWDGP